MFATTIKIQPDGSPLEIIRRYVPFLAIAGISVATVAAIYYKGFEKSEEMTNETFDAATDSIETGQKVADEASSAAAEKVGLDGSAKKVADW